MQECINTGKGRIQLHSKLPNSFEGVIVDSTKDRDNFVKDYAVNESQKQFLLEGIDGLIMWAWKAFEANRRI